jgi:D-alanyl-D-alanine carboxypeptidase
MEVMGRRGASAVTLGVVALTNLSACTVGAPAETGEADGAVHTVRSIQWADRDLAKSPRRRSGGSLSSPIDRTAHSLTEPQSEWVIVNKRHPISPESYRPAEISVVRGYQVASMVSRPLAHLLRASDEAGLGFKIASAYRSYQYQASVHAQVVAEQGPAAANRVSARPGLSEHQTGLAVDLITPAHPECDFRSCFASTVAGKWLRHHVADYGFIVRYTRRNEPFTGYAAEPWHIRYVGLPLAREMARDHVDSLEQFFGVSGGSSHRSP